MSTPVPLAQMVGDENARCPRLSPESLRNKRLAALCHAGSGRGHRERSHPGRPHAKANASSLVTIENARVLRYGPNPNKQSMT